MYLMKPILLHQVLATLMRFLWMSAHHNHHNDHTLDPSYLQLSKDHKESPRILLGTPAWLLLLNQNSNGLLDQAQQLAQHSTATRLILQQRMCIEMQKVVKLPCKDRLLQTIASVRNFSKQTTGTKSIQRILQARRICDLRTTLRYPRHRTSNLHLKSHHKTQRLGFFLLGLWIHYAKTLKLLQWHHDSTPTPKVHPFGKQLA